MLNSNSSNINTFYEIMLPIKQIIYSKNSVIYVLKLTDYLEK